MKNKSFGLIIVTLSEYELKLIAENISNSDSVAVFVCSVVLKVYLYDI